MTHDWAEAVERAAETVNHTSECANSCTNYLPCDCGAAADAARLRTLATALREAQQRYDNGYVVGEYILTLPNEAP